MNRMITTRVDILRNNVKYDELSIYERLMVPKIIMSTDGLIKMSMTGHFLRNAAVDYLNDQLKPYLVIDGAEYPLGVFVPATVENNYDNQVSYDYIEGYDRALILKQTKIESRLSIAAGTSYLSEIESLLMTAGIDVVLADVCTDTIQTIREDWEIGESYLTIINDLLSEINFMPLWFDLNGIARLTRYQAPSASRIQHTYESGTLSIIKSECVSKLDTYSAPNVFMAEMSNPDYGSTAIIKTAENDNPNSSLSTIRRGRRIMDSVIHVNNIASEDALQTYIDNVCTKSMISTEEVEFNTALNPVHAVGDVLALKHEHLSGVFEETYWDLSMAPGKLMKHKAKRVMYL